MYSFPSSRLRAKREKKSDLNLSDRLCPGTELNRYGPYGPQDFKSCVSTNSTTRAYYKNFSNCCHPRFFNRGVSPNSTSYPDQYRGTRAYQKNFFALRPPRFSSGRVYQFHCLPRSISGHRAWKKKSPLFKERIDERKTGLEPATPTLARSCSTK